MTALYFGSSPRLEWARSILDALRERAPPGVVPLARSIDGPLTRELLVALASEPIDALVLVDPFPFAAGPPPDGTPLVEAVRSEAQRAIFALELARRAGRTVVLSGDPQAWIADLVGLCTAPTPELPDFAQPPVLPAWVGLDDAPFLRNYLQPLCAAPAGKSPLVLAWARESFLDGDAPGETLPATVEVAGRARILAYGPYLPLPSGAWHATTFLGFSPDIGKLPFILEADAGGTISRGFFEVDRGGIFTLELDFQVVDPLHPVELRLISQDSALDGQAALIEVRLEQRPTPT